MGLQENVQLYAKLLHQKIDAASQRVSPVQRQQREIAQALPVEDSLLRICQRILRQIALPRNQDQLLLLDLLMRDASVFLPHRQKDKIHIAFPQGANQLLR